MLSLGDIFGDDHTPFTTTSKELQELHLDYRPFLGNICHSIPFYFCLGNHEGEMDYYLLQNPGANIAVWGTLWRKFYYPNPYPNAFYSGNTKEEEYGIGTPENYYAWTWGDALFVVLDVYRDQCDTSAKPQNWNWSLGYPQYSWLKKTLEESSSKYKFVFAHHVRGQGRGAITNAKLFEWGGNDSKGTYQFDKYRPNWGKPIHQLFVDNGVNIFFQGHDHLFAKQEMDCLIYQECPQPSHPNFSGVNSAKDYGYLNGEILPNSGHMRIRVQPNQIQVEYVRAYLPKNETGNRKNKDVAATYTIPVNKCYDSLSTGIAMFWNDEYLRNEPYPNPSNGSMIFPLDIKQAGQYDLNIYDNKGIRRKTLSEEISLEPNLYHIQWNGIGDDGLALESGSFLYVLSQDGKPIVSGSFLIR